MASTCLTNVPKFSNQFYSLNAKRRNKKSWKMFSSRAITHFQQRIMFSLFTQIAMCPCTIALLMPIIIVRLSIAFVSAQVYILSSMMHITVLCEFWKRTGVHSHSFTIKMLSSVVSKRESSKNYWFFFAFPLASAHGSRFISFDSFALVRLSLSFILSETRLFVLVLATLCLFIRLFGSTIFPFWCDDSRPILLHAFYIWTHLDSAAVLLSVPIKSAESPRRFH